MAEHIEFIPKAGASLATKNVLEGRGRVRWMVRRPSRAAADNGWQIMSHVDTSDYLNDTANWQIVDYNDLCAIEPALIGIWDLPVGSDLQLVNDELGVRILDTPTGREIPRRTSTCHPSGDRSDPADERARRPPQTCQTRRDDHEFPAPPTARRPGSRIRGSAPPRRLCPRVQSKGLGSGDVLPHNTVDHSIERALPDQCSGRPRERVDGARLRRPGVRLLRGER